MAKSRKKPRNLATKRRTRPGTAPGTLIADPDAIAGQIRLIAYDKERLEEPDNISLDTIREARARGLKVWVDITGLADIDLIKRIGTLFGLHRLALEDVINTHQRPKTEDFDDHLFIVTRMPTGEETAQTEQVSLFLGADYVLTFQEHPGDCFDPIRDRLRRGKGRIRGAGADYLAYGLLDTVTDFYFPVLEAYGEQLEDMEADITLSVRPAMIDDIHRLKRDMLSLRRTLWPQREMLNALTRDDSKLIDPATRVYFRDCYDHLIQLMDMLETYREITFGLLDLYLSMVSTRLNEIMKVLTIIATVFIPLSFITGLYGMNFDRDISPWNMPELGWTFGYPFALFMMLITGVGLLWYLWRKKWIGNRPDI